MMKTNKQRNIGGISAWFSSQLAQLKKFRRILDLAMILTIFGLFLAIVSLYRSESSNDSIVIELKKIITVQRETLELIRTEGKLPPELQSNGIVFNSDRKSSSTYQLTVTKYYDKVNPPQLEINGNISKQTESTKYYWLGIRSGLQLWPHIRLSNQILNAGIFKYRIPVPADVRTGTVVLLKVGEATNKSFIGYQDYAVSNLKDIGFYFPHLSDATIITSDEFETRVHKKDRR